SVRDRLFKRLLQARLDNVDVAALECFDGFPVHVEAADLKASLREGDRGRQADIAQPHDSNFHSIDASLMTFSVHYTTFFANFNQRFEFFAQSRYNDSVLISYPNDRMYVL